MFIFNLKVNGNKFIKILMAVLAIIILIITFIICYNLIFNNFFQTNDTSINKGAMYELNTKNYTNVLKNVHSDIDKYIGQKIKFSGYVYRLNDFTEEQFVLARDMIVTSDFQTVVVGFLCQYKDADNFEDGTWVNLTGSIQMGKYHNEEIPIIKVTEIEETAEPANSFVNPPSDTYIPTSGML